MKDKQVESILKKEQIRQKSVINLIASENYVSKDVLSALSSELTNKYAEGYAKARYYGGNTQADAIEEICKARALKLFKLKKTDWHVNVQALSGSPANLAVYTALVPLGGKIMGLALDQGGHLTHGHKASVSGKWWKQVMYTLDKETELLDYNAIRSIALKEKPVLIVAGYTAYSRIIDWKKFRAIADEVGAHFHVDMSHIAGLVAGGVYPSPFPYADTVMTTTHKTLRGPRSALIFSRIDERTLHTKIDKAVFPGLQGGPHLNQIAAAAVALGEAVQPAFKAYTKAVIKNAKALELELQNKGWRIVSGGTDTHLFLMDTWMNGKGIPGDRASIALEKAGIIVNKNPIPFDSRTPVEPSGIRIGTAAETTRGTKNMARIAEQIDTVLRKAIKSYAR